MATRIQLRRDTAANWTSVDPVLAEGEPGVETDTGKHKIGDGVTAWAGLSYFIDEAALSATFVPLSLGWDGTNPAPAANNSLVNLTKNDNLGGYLLHLIGGPNWTDGTGALLGLGVGDGGEGGGTGLLVSNKQTGVGVSVTNTATSGTGSIGVQIVNQGASSVGLLLQSQNAGDSGPLLKVEDHNGTETLWVDQWGEIYVTNLQSVAGTGAYIAPSGDSIIVQGRTDNVQLQVNANGTQSSDLFQIRDHSGNPLWGVTGAGFPKWESASLVATGSGSAALGANCPATAPAAPNQWAMVVLPSGSTGYIPVWV